MLYEVIPYTYKEFYLELNQLFMKHNINKSAQNAIKDLLRKHLPNYNLFPDKQITTSENINSSNSSCCSNISSIFNYY